MSSYRPSLLALSLLTLTACASTPHPEGKPLPGLTFENIQPIGIDVRTIHIPPEKDVHPAGFIMSPSEAMRTYMGRRFTARGSRDTLRVFIEEATVTRAEKPAANKVARTLNLAGHDIYNVKIRLVVQQLADNGQLLHARTLTANRTMSITEHASVAEREQHQFAGMEEMFSDLDAAITNIVLNEMKLGHPGF